MSNETSAVERQGAASAASYETLGSGSYHESPTFCPCCGDRLTNFTWVAVADLGFCRSCSIHRKLICLETLALLNVGDWTSFIGSRHGILWLSPIDRRFWLMNLEAIASTRRLQAANQYGSEPAALYYDDQAATHVLRNQDSDWVPCLMVPNAARQ